MSYSMRSSLGNNVGASCMKLQVEYDRDAYLPDKLCPEYVGETGHHPPRPRVCSGSMYSVQTALKYAGLYSGPVDGQAGAGTKAVLMAVMRNQNTSWDGDIWSFGPSQCAALIREVAQRAPACPGTYPDIGCVVPPTGGEAPPPAEPPPASPPDSGASMRSAITSLARQRVPATSSGSGVTLPSSARIRVATTSRGDEYDVGGGMTTEPPPTNGSTVHGTDDGIPTWAYVAGGAVALGGVAYLVLKKG